MQLCYVFFIIYLVKDSISDSAVYGLSPVTFSEEVESENGVLLFGSGKDLKFYLYGTDLSDDLKLGVSKNEDCEFVYSAEMKAIENSQGHLAVMSLKTPKTEEGMLKNVKFFLCLKHESGAWKAQTGTDKAYVYIYDPFLELTIGYIIVIIVLCFSLSSLMSGLNIGLFTLDENELHLLREAGTDKEKKYAKTIIPIRRTGNFLLCSILITCTICNAAATVLIESLMTDLLTVVISTIIIVVMCEITPQAVCNKFALVIGAKTVYITKTCMFLTAPVSYPLSRVLNIFLGKELKSPYSRDRLKELLKMTVLPAAEERIISGALDLNKKTVLEVMTMLDDVFKLPITAELNFDTISSIVNSGYSRIPIYQGDKSNIQHVLLTKDLALINPEHNIPVSTLLNSSKYSCQYIPTDTTLDSALALFKGSRRHMAFVVDPFESITDAESLKDDTKRVVGLVTFEDVMEEILQMEINDETDTFLDNRSKKALPGASSHSLLQMLSKYKKKPVSPSENLKLAAFHFLSGTELFSYKHISPNVLMNLLNMDIYSSSPGHGLAQDKIYTRGVPANFFTMVLEGQFEVRVGKENFKFPSGSFRTFGEGALQPGSTSDYIPDYSVQAVTKTLYLKVNRELYEAAILATRYEMLKEIPDLNESSISYKYYKQLIPEMRASESRTISGTSQLAKPSEG